MEIAVLLNPSCTTLFKYDLIKCFPLWSSHVSGRKLTSEAYTFESLHFVYNECHTQSIWTPTTRGVRGRPLNNIQCIWKGFTFWYSHGFFRRLSLCDIEYPYKISLSLVQRWRPLSQLEQGQTCPENWRENVVITSLSQYFRNCAGSWGWVSNKLMLLGGTKTKL